MSLSGLLPVLLMLFAGLYSVVGSHRSGSDMVGKVKLRLPDANVQVPALSVPLRRRTKDVNMMLPPTDRLDLCSPLSSRSLSSGTTRSRRYQTAYSSNNDVPPLPSIALLVGQSDDDQCSFVEKAYAAAEYQRTLEPNLEFILIRGIDVPDTEQGVRLPESAALLFHMSTTERLAFFGDINFIFLNSTHWNVLSEQLSEHVDVTGASPFLPKTSTWNLRLRIEPTNDDGSYEIRIIWGTLFCMAAIASVFLVLLCRHQHHYSVRQSDVSGEAASETAAKRLLTREQVMALPEVIYPTDVVGLLEASKDEPPERLGDSKSIDLPQVCSSSSDEEKSERSVPITEHSTSSEGDLLEQVCSCSSDDHGSERSVPISEQSEEEESSSSLSMCSICIHEYQDGERLRMLPACRHVYHTECIVPWLTERHASCPYCKTKVEPVEEDPLRDGAASQGRQHDDLPV